MTVLTYAMDRMKVSRWGLLALGAALLANVLMGMNVVFAHWVGEPAYEAVRKAGNDMAAAAAYAHYRNLKAIAVTLFLVTLGLLLVSLVAGVLGVVKNDSKRWPAIMGLVLAGAVVVVLAVMG